MDTYIDVYSLPLIVPKGRLSSRRCRRGLPVTMEFDQREACRCPSSFYGDQCEYQNERVSLTIQCRALSDSWQTLFSAVALPILETDQQRLVQLSEQFTYLLSSNHLPCQQQISPFFDEVYLLSLSKVRRRRSSELFAVRSSDKTAVKTVLNVFKIILDVLKHRCAFVLSASTGHDANALGMHLV